MANSITRWRFIGLIALALLLDLAVYLYTQNEGLALLCAMLFGAAAILLGSHSDQGRD